MFIRTFAAKLWTPLTFARLKPPFPNSPRGPASVETQVQRHLYIPPGRRYARFQQPKRNIFARWASRPTFYYEVGALGGVTAVYYIYNLEEVPVTHRRRFNVISPDQEKALSQQMYASILQQYRGQFLSRWDRRTQLVERVLNRLIRASGLTEENWEVHVIDDPQTNAFVIPGGKVFVFSGILPVAQSEDGLAAVLGHEIAHNVAHHTAERVSKGIIPLGIGMLLYLFSDPFTSAAARTILDFVFTAPGSRVQESEADYIGLMMMAQSCFDPSAAVGLWDRMEKAEVVKVPQFLSTHPSSHNRRTKIAEWLPEAEQKRVESDCRSVLDHANAFKRVYGQLRW